MTVPIRSAVVTGSSAAAEGADKPSAMTTQQPAQCILSERAGLHSFSRRPACRAVETIEKFVLPHLPPRIRKAHGNGICAFRKALRTSGLAGAYSRSPTGSPTEAL